MLQLLTMNQKQDIGIDSGELDSVENEAAGGRDPRQNQQHESASIAAISNVAQSAIGNSNNQSAYLSLMRGQWPNGGGSGNINPPGTTPSLANACNILGSLPNPALNQSSAAFPFHSALDSQLQDALGLSNLVPPSGLGGRPGAAANVPIALDLEAARIASANVSRQRQLLTALAQPSFQQNHLLSLLNPLAQQTAIRASVPASSPSWLTGRVAASAALTTPLGAPPQAGSPPDLSSSRRSREETARKSTDSHDHGAARNSSNKNESSVDSDRFSLVLYMEGDENALTEYQCLLRKQLEIFEAGPKDVRSSSQGRNTPILLGQVGLRCRHCANLPVAARTKGAIYFSQTIDGIYQIAQNMSKVHLCERCYRIPTDIQRRLVALRSDCRRASGGKEYWAEGIRSLGVYEDGHILRMRKPASSDSKKDEKI